jgi:hypothetical protein
VNGELGGHSRNAFKHFLLLLWHLLITEKVTLYKSRGEFCAEFDIWASLGQLGSLEFNDLQLCWLLIKCQLI